MMKTTGLLMGMVVTSFWLNEILATGSTADFSANKEKKSCGLEEKS
jgi:hypothetical protein